MKKYMVFMNDGNSYMVKADSEDKARDKMVQTSIDGHTSISGVYEL